MKILYINKTFAGPMEPLVRFMAKGPAASSVFIAERWPREAQVPGVMLMRIPTVNITNCGFSAGQGPAEQAEVMMRRNMRNAANVVTACWRLRKSGFIPDVIYATAHDGYAQNVQDVFPDVRMAVRSDWYYLQKSQPVHGTAQQERLPSYERMLNAFQLVLLAESAVGVTPSQWQKLQLGEWLQEKIQVLANGIDTHFFAPPAVACRKEVVTFACQGTSAARGIHTICECLPKLLALRPKCRVNIVSFAPRRSETVIAQHIEEVAALLPPLGREQSRRVNIVASPSPTEYRTLLQQSRVYVYLTAPALLSSGILEAMSCGTLVLASSTSSISELVDHEVNGVLWNGTDGQSLALEAARLCTNAKDFKKIRRAARETILENHDVRALLPRHAAIVLGHSLT